MTTALSLSQLFGSSIGFDRFDSLFSELSRPVGNSERFPPYDIERIGEDQYEITISVAGFSQHEIGLAVQDNQLTVTGTKNASEPDRNTYLYRGIGSHSFSQIFQLAPYVTVEAAELKDGLLRLHLQREVPQEKKPRRIEIRVREEPQAIAAPQDQAA